MPLIPRFWKNILTYRKKKEEKKNQTDFMGLQSSISAFTKLPVITTNSQIIYKDKIRKVQKKKINLQLAFMLRTHH